MKVLTAEKVKRLQTGTVVFAVKDSTGDRALFLIVKSGRKKLLKGTIAEHEIKDLPGWHYEVFT